LNVRNCGRWLLARTTTWVFLAGAIGSLALFINPRTEATQISACDPCCCKENVPGDIVGPATVPSLSQYDYRIVGDEITNITWTLTSLNGMATLKPDTVHDQTCTVIFSKDGPDVVTLKASFMIAGQPVNPNPKKKEIVLVQVEIGQPIFPFTNPGGCQDPGGVSWFNRMDRGTCITHNDPGSAWDAFQYSGSQTGWTEFGLGVGGVGSVFLSTKFTMTAPNPTNTPGAKQDYKDRINCIQVGFLQKITAQGHAVYKDVGNTTIGGRKLTWASQDTVDWAKPETRWPWYLPGQRPGWNGDAFYINGCTTEGFTLNPVYIRLRDQPYAVFPTEYHMLAPLTHLVCDGPSQSTLGFWVHAAARTIEKDNDANKHYFAQGIFLWTQSYIPQTDPSTGQAVIQTNDTAWRPLDAPTEVSVNVIPAVKEGNFPFATWPCYTDKFVTVENKQIRIGASVDVKVTVLDSGFDPVVGAKCYVYDYDPTMVDVAWPSGRSTDSEGEVWVRVTGKQCGTCNINVRSKDAEVGSGLITILDVSP
jgi:hypothetical protein